MLVALPCLRRVARHGAQLFALLLAACGGGDSDNPAPTVPLVTLNRVPLAVVAAPVAAMVGRGLTLDGRSSRDPDGDTLRYRWIVELAPAESRSPLVDALSASPRFVPDVKGSYVMRLTVDDGQSGTGTATVSVEAAASDLAVVSSAPEPLVRDTVLSLSGAVEGRVQWYAGSKWIGTGAADAGSSLLWNADIAHRNTVVDSLGSVEARIDLPGGVTQVVSRFVFLERRDNGTGVNLAATVADAGDEQIVDVVPAIFPSYTARISTRLDGVERDALSAPNACSPGCSTPDTYRFRIPVSALASAGSALQISATDSAGRSGQITARLIDRALPTLTVTEPANGQLAYGRLTVAGTVSSRRTGPVSVIVTLQGRVVLRTVGPGFLGSIDLAGLAAGRYALTVTATDDRGAVRDSALTVYVTGSPEDAIVPVLTLPVGARVSAYRDGRVVIANGIDGATLQSLDGGRAVPLQSAGTLLSANPQLTWAIDGDRAYAGVNLSDCVGGANGQARLCAYEWASDGSVRNLTLSDPAAGSPQGEPLDHAYSLQAHDGRVMWQRGSYYGLTLFDPASRRYSAVPVPSGTNTTRGYAFHVQNGVTDVFIASGPNSVQSPFIDRWRSDGSPMRRLGSGQIPSTDGRRIAWAEGPIFGWAPLDLFTVPFDGVGVPASYKVHDYESFKLSDGVLAWQEAGTSRQARGPLKVSPSSGDVLTLPGVLVGVGGGRVYYRWSGTVPGVDGLYAFDTATRSQRRVSATYPDQVFIDGKTLLLRFDSSVYRLKFD